MRNTDRYTQRHCTYLTLSFSSPFSLTSFLPDPASPILHALQLFPCSMPPDGTPTADLGTHVHYPSPPSMDICHLLLGSSPSSSQKQNETASRNPFTSPPIDCTPWSNYIYFSSPNPTPSLSPLLSLKTVQGLSTTVQLFGTLHSATTPEESHILSPTISTLLL